MTREEAINQLQDAKDGYKEYLTNEVLDMAIEALEQEPQTFKWCTDCREYDQEKHCCHRWSKVIRDTVEEMKQEQEPKTGHWVKEKSVYGWDDHSYQCSKCGRSIHLDTAMESLIDYPYCHCGAKMESEVEE